MVEFLNVLRLKSYSISSDVSFEVGGSNETILFIRPKGEDFPFYFCSSSQRVESSK